MGDNARRNGNNSRYKSTMSFEFHWLLKQCHNATSDIDSAILVFPKSSDYQVMKMKPHEESPCLFVRIGYSFR